MANPTTTSAGIDPARVPYRTAWTGAKIPAIGLGTFGSDRFSPSQVATAVKSAIEVGFRHIDCASVYGNEPEIGHSLAAVLKNGPVKREHLWITSKLWNDKHKPEDVVPSCEKSLRDLQLDYLDLYLIHWPFPNFHPPRCDVSSRSPDARPYIHENYMKTWRQLEKLVQKGLVRHIGTSNMTLPKLQLLLRDAQIKPACNEMELHPHFQQPALFDYVVKNGIVPIGYCPIGSPNRPDRDRTIEDTSPADDPIIQRIAAKHAVHPATICIQWAVQRGQIPIPFSVKVPQFLSNLQCTFTDPLTAQEMQEIARLDRNCRLIKGQVFLWKDNQAWEDLWDVKGTISA